MRNYFTHDPEYYDFKAGDLPALYLFRTGSAKDTENFTEDWRVTTDKVTVQWVLPPASQIGTMPARARALGFIAKVVDAALRRGRDPAFIIDGDADPQSAVEGSVVIRHAGLTKLECTKWRSGQIAIQKFGGDHRELFPAMIAELTIAEIFQDLPGTAVPDALGPTAELTTAAAIDATITVDDFEAAEFLEPTT